jgi:DHA1 family bicyclomycin/chloramphenicol resistance-like MFS transporter
MTAMPAPPRLPPFWIVVAITVLGPFSLHVVIPAMQPVATEFGTGLADAQATLTAYLIGIAAGQLAWGPVSDRFGRRPVVLAGMALFLAASLGCALAQSLDMLLAARLLQGVTGSAGQVLGRAIIRDCVPRDRAASLMGYATMAMSCCASFSPLASALIQDLAGWRSVFFCLAAAAVLILTCAYLALGETKLDRLDGQGPLRLAGNYVTLLRSPAFLAYALSTAFANATWYAFVAGAPYVLVQILGLPPIAYGKYVLIVLAGYIAGSFFAGWLSVRLGGGRMIAIGQALALAGTALQLAILAAGILTPLALFVPMTLVVFASGLFLPNTNAGALSVHPGLAGSAAGLTGFLQMGLGALVTVAIADWMADTETPMVLAMAAASLLSALSLALLPRAEIRSRVPFRRGDPER